MIQRCFTNGMMSRAIPVNRAIQCQSYAAYPISIKAPLAISMIVLSLAKQAAIIPAPIQIAPACMEYPRRIHTNPMNRNIPDNARMSFLFLDDSWIFWLAVLVL